MKKTREALWFPALQYFILLTALGIEINVGGAKKATPEVQVYFTTTPPKAGENFLRPLQQKRLHPRANISVVFRNFFKNFSEASNINSPPPCPHWVDGCLYGLGLLLDLFLLFYYCYFY